MNNKIIVRTAIKAPSPKWVAYLKNESKNGLLASFDRICNSVFEFENISIPQIERNKTYGIRKYLFLLNKILISGYRL